MKKVARSLEEAAGFGPCALTIGNFDGVHTGHQALLRATVEEAQALGVKAGALTFDPHPSRIVAPDRAPKLLCSLDQRCAEIVRCGIEEILVLPFTHEVAQLSPEEFATGILRDRLQTRAVVVGQNFRFGHRHAGDNETLHALGHHCGFRTHVLGCVESRGLVVSSTEIRRRVEAGEVGLAGRLLGHPYALSGEVVPGHGVGAKQTVPTLNLRTDAEVLPRGGVYITRTTDADTSRRWNSISNIGYRPTFGGDALSIETFLLARTGPARPSQPATNSTDAAAPGSVVRASSEIDPLESPPPTRIRVEFLRRVREERKFENPEALKAQILRDVGRAQAFFRRTSPLLQHK